MRYNERIRQIREVNSLTRQKIADLLYIGQRTYFYNVSMDYITGAGDFRSEYPKEQTAAFSFRNAAACCYNEPAPGV